MEVKHVIFDCDGVLVDSEPLSMRADVSLLQRFGIKLTEAEAHQRFVGKTFQAMLDEMTTEFGVIFPPGQSAVKDKMVEDLYHAELKIVPGVADVLEALRSKNISCSIGSNSPRARVELAVRLTGIADHFQRIVSVADVANGKPAPDIFLKAAKLAGAAPRNCIVVEDSVAGATAGVAAQIRTIGFVGTHHDPAIQSKLLRNVGAAATIETMPDLLHHL
jgi:HAD superfamily hydrolase (TIGR01509 family)